MKILIVAATETEVKPLIENLKQKPLKDTDTKSFVFGNLNIDILVSGIGMVAKAYATGRQLQKEQYDLALNVGIAGSFKDEIPVGETVNVVREQFPEMGAEDGESFIPLVSMGFREFNEFPYRNGILVNDTDFRQFGLDHLKKAVGITSNTVHGNAATISKIVTDYNPDVETMGGGGFLFACLKEHLPCAEIRAISNKVEVRDRSRWKVQEAVAQLTGTLLKTFDIINTFDHS